jgi:hypothetical protein
MLLIFSRGGVECRICEEIVLAKIKIDGSHQAEHMFHPVGAKKSRSKSRMIGPSSSWKRSGAGGASSSMHRHQDTVSCANHTFARVECVSICVAYKAFRSALT